MSAEPLARRGGRRTKRRRLRCGGRGKRAVRAAGGGQGDRRRVGACRRARRCPIGLPGGGAARRWLRATSLPGLRARASERSRGGGSSSSRRRGSLPGRRSGKQPVSCSPAVSGGGVRASVLVQLRRACCFSRLGACSARSLAGRRLRSPAADDDRLSGGRRGGAVINARPAGSAVLLEAGWGRAAALVSLRPLPPRRARFARLGEGACRRGWPRNASWLRDDRLRGSGRPLRAIFFSALRVWLFPR